MKNLSFLMIASFASLIFFSSCSSSDDCQHCHIALPDGNGGETAWDISNPNGGDEFCGDELTDVENPDKTVKSKPAFSIILADKASKQHGAEIKFLRLSSFLKFKAELLMYFIK